VRLLSAQVQNYRVHRNTEVAFDGDLILIHGPNESGKSTLAEAVHCALFLKAKGSTSLHTRMQSTSGGDPEVRLEFEAGKRRHTLTKRFGSKGNTTLESEGQATLNGDDAESALAHLLGVDGTVSGGGIEGKMKQRWAHLWVWQGESNQSPIESLSETNNQLREKLQASSGQTITSSARDSQVIESLQDLIDSAQTSTGRTKAGSDLAKAEDALEKAQSALAEKQEILQQLEQAATSYEQAAADRLRYSASLTDAEDRLKRIDKQLIAVREIRDRLKEKTREREDLGKDLSRLKESDTEIRNLTSELETARKEAAPGEAEVKRLETELAQDKKTYDQAIQTREDAAKAVTQCRTATDALQAQVNALQTRAQIAKLQKQVTSVTKLKKEAQSLRQRLAPLDAFTTKSLQSLRKQANAATEARARLDAYALQLEVLESDQDIAIEGKTLAPGVSKTLDHSAELTVGQGTRIRISPGGADDLRDAQEQSRQAESNLTKALHSLTVSSLEEAERKLQERNALEAKLETFEEKLEEQEADEIEAQLDEANQSLSRYESQRDTLSGKAGLEKIPDQLKPAEADQADAQDTLRAEEQKEQQALATEKASRRKFEKTEQSLNAARSKHQSAQKTVHDLESKLKYWVESSGETEARTKAILKVEAQLEKAVAAEKQEREALEKLGADQLELDQRRLTDAATKDRTNLTSAEERITIARTELKSSGSTDPERECKELEAEVEQFERRQKALRHQTDVRAYLLERLKAARKATTEALARPLEDKVRPYLQLLFGGSNPKLHWAEDGSCLESFELDRSQNRGGVHDFNSLSHGTREQVALALRLAMAELLATDHNDCLPIVLDDAFTNADSDRREKLKSLLYQASQSGLQIILLSCHPENYSGLSASEAGL